MYYCLSHAALTTRSASISADLSLVISCSSLHFPRGAGGLRGDRLVGLAASGDPGLDIPFMFAAARAGLVGDLYHDWS